MIFGMVLKKNIEKDEHRNGNEFKKSEIIISREGLSVELVEFLYSLRKSFKDF